MADAAPMVKYVPKANMEAERGAMEKKRKARKKKRMIAMGK
jgi:hypothetical protein